MRSFDIQPPVLTEKFVLILDNLGFSSSYVISFFENLHLFTAPS